MSNDLLEPLLTQIITSNKLSPEAKKSILDKSGIQLTNQVNDLNDQGYTLLGEMCKYQNRELIIEWLLTQGADIEKGFPEQGQTPLAIASEYGHLRTMQLLLEHDAKIGEYQQVKALPEWRDGCIHLGKPPIYYAIRYGQVEAVELLVAYGSLEVITLTTNLECLAPAKNPSPLAFARELLNAAHTHKQSTNRSILTGDSKRTPKQQDLLKIIMILKCAESLIDTTTRTNLSETK